ncbi:MAG: quinoprotein dehydrogenase-associated SoxYZ-like carrier [Hyphomicrobiaceae bacterium]|nr:quinoprotein dehydrogenase-associated SoxYZ-like carrier [Hyphomicrobiaceae bacterium]
MKRRLKSVIAAIVAATAPFATAVALEDPLHSVVWADMKEQFFGAAPVVFDDRIKVIVPRIVENQAQVPITADARALGGVQKLVIFADLNPIQHVATVVPKKASPFIALLMKVEQATPVRAAALLDDGTWHVGGVYLDAAGGGCSAPALARKDADWSDTVGHAQGRMWRDIDGAARVRFRLRHPMDTGLARDNTPAFFIERLDMRAADGQSLAEVELREPVSEDPTITMVLRLPAKDPGLTIIGRDNNGTVYQSVIPAGWKQSGASSRDGG